METTLRRIYVGGISPSVTKAELEDRFGKFGKIEDVDILCRRDAQGNPVKTFAYLNINISDVDLKKCMSVLNKTKWKGGILQIEKAKESFLHRLSKERQEAKEKEEASAPCLQNDIVLSLEKAGVKDFLMKFAVPGTEVPNHKNWVVSKFGRVLPVLHLNGKKQSKIIKYDPSKFCHNIKKIDDTFELVPVSQLTWQLEGGDNQVGRKRRGEFPNLMSYRKKAAIIPPLSGGYNNTQIDQRISLASIQTSERQSDTKEKHGHFENSSINNMTDEYDTEEELQVVNREAATRGICKYAEDCNIEVVDDSSELSYSTHCAKQNATPKMKSTCINLDDSEYESANTDEIITVAKTLQERCDHFKKKADAVKNFNQIKIQKYKDRSTFSHGTKDECKSTDSEMSKSESDSETSASENSSSFYSDEEYKAMMQNCFKLVMTVGDLETLAKEANEFENENADDKTENDSEYDTDDLNSKPVYGVAETLMASASEIPILEKIPHSRQASAGIKKKLNTENLQRVLESGSQGNCGESDSSDSDCLRENIKTEALKPKSPKALKCPLNHELKKRANCQKGETNKSIGYPGFEKVKAKRDLKPDDIVASFSEGDGIGGQQSSRKKKKATRVKPPAFKGLSSVSAYNRHISSSSDISEECNSSLSSITSANKATMLKVKQKQDNQKRLVAMMERRKELELQKQIIQGALLELDSKCLKKSQHFVFNSDSGSDEEEASTSEKKNMFAHNKANQSTSKLFNSSEEESDNDQKEDNERFETKAQYEGRSGMKLMQLQSRFGNDDRFKMDSRFLESSSEDEASEAHNSKVDEYDLSAEKKKNLGILQRILNINVDLQPARKPTTKGKKFKDLNFLNYDPAKEDHATFETKAEEKESKSERMKKRLEAEKIPDVSKQTFHEISMDFRKVFGTSKTENTKGQETTWDQEVEPEKKEAQKSRSSELFSLQNQNTDEPIEFTFSFFGNTTEESTSNGELYKTKMIKPAKVAWQEDPRFQDSSSEDDVKETTVAKENKTSTQPDKSTIRFFFVNDDDRLKAGPTMFYRSSSTEQEAEVWEQKKDILLEECRKRHKDAKRKTKAKN